MDEWASIGDGFLFIWNGKTIGLLSTEIIIFQVNNNKKYKTVID